jgi:hypothetical protein
MVHTRRSLQKTTDCQAQQRQIRRVIKKRSGRMIDGPSVNGQYTLAFPQAGSTTTDSFLAGLNFHTDLIRLAQPTRP